MSLAFNDSLAKYREYCRLSGSKDLMLVVHSIEYLRLVNESSNDQMRRDFENLDLTPELKERVKKGLYPRFRESIKLK